MALERNLSAVPPVLLTVDGGATGVVQVSSTCNFFVKQQIIIQASSVPPLNLEIKRVVNLTTIWVGLPGAKMTHNVDVSMYTVALGSFIFANEQPKAVLSMEARMLASYMQEPSNSWRTTSVDCNGNPWDAENPLPVAFDGTVSIGKVEVAGTNGNIIEPNVDGSINVNIVSTPTAGNDVVNRYSEANAGASGIITTVVQYTLPLSKTNGVLIRISVSGENIAKWTVFLNAVQLDTRRTFYGNLNEYFEFATGGVDGVVLSPGDSVIVKVIHNKPYVADFEGRIEILEIM